MITYDSILLTILAPMVLAGIGLWTVRFLKGDFRKKSPFSKKVLRYPGYTLVKRIDDLNDRQDSLLVALLLFPALILALASSGIFSPFEGHGGWVFRVFYLGVLGTLIWVLFRTTDRIIRARRGLYGEQIVGHELSRLWRDGYQVFHDFPLHRANIDHIVVGPAGVFAIETKYRRKPKGRKDGHIVRLKGDTLRFPTGTDNESVSQARRQGNELQQLLARMFGAIAVKPVVILPGWYVKREGARSDVLVANGKGGIKIISASEGDLSAEQINSIGAFLRDRCSDVEC